MRKVDIAVLSRGVEKIAICKQKVKGLPEDIGEIRFSFFFFSSWIIFTCNIG